MITRRYGGPQKRFSLLATPVDPTNMRQRTKISTVIGLIATALLFYGCSYNRPMPQGLVNEGILPLSARNPYVGANYFISREMDRSKFLRNFIQSNGAPSAIELTGDGIDPTKLYMFYPRTEELYIATSDDTAPSYQWVIRGPYRIERHSYRRVRQIQSELYGEPVLLSYGREKRFNAYIPKPPDKTSFTPEIPPTPVPTPKPKRKPVKKKAEPKDEFNIMKLPDTFKPLNTDQQALRIAQGYAERSSNGDLIHTVKFDGETIQKIAKWYTQSVDKSGQIAKLNGIPAEGPLDKGLRVTIPLAMLKQLKAMPSSAN